MVRRLWEACQIPDFRKLADDTHTRLCARVFGHIARDRHLPTDWLAGQIGALARADGDIDTLMQRLAGVRVWSYIAARADWVQDSAHWQGRAREVEDLLSDALHERLTSRFVDRRAAHLMRRLDAGDGAGTALGRDPPRRGDRRGPSGRPRRRLQLLPDPAAEGDEKRLVLRAARRALREEMPRRVAVAETAPDAAFAFGRGQHAGLGRRAGRAAEARQQRAAAARPDAGQRVPRRRAARAAAHRLQRFVDDKVGKDLAPLLAAAERGRGQPEFRGLLHRLTEALGLIVGDEGDALRPQARAALKAIGVKAGRFGLFVPALLKPRAAAMRARLWGVQHGVAAPGLPAPDLGLAAAPAGLAGGLRRVRWAGWRPGPVLLRLDIAERVAAELAWAARRGAHSYAGGAGIALFAEGGPAAGRAAPSGLPGGARWCACRRDEFGPPAPAMLLPLRRRRAVVPNRPPPFTHTARSPLWRR